MAELVTQVGLLRSELQSASAEIRELRKENTLLRQQLDAARGVHQHQPYAVHTTEPQPVPAKSRTAGDLTPERPLDQQGETVMTSPPGDPDSKKARRSLQPGLDASSSTPGGPSGP